jgi:hypothetical protein
MIFSAAAPMLDPEMVCDEIVKGVRQNKHLVLIPKSLNIPIILNRFE